MAEEPRARRRTIVVYRHTGPDADAFPQGLLESAAPADSAPNTPRESASREKLSKYKNLMYSPREADLLVDLAKFLIVSQPTFVLAPSAHALHAVPPNTISDLSRRGTESVPRKIAGQALRPLFLALFSHPNAYFSCGVKVVKEFFNLTEKSDYDDLAECLVSLSFGSSTVFQLLRYFVEDEFATNNSQAVMRENCMASKLVKAYLKKFAHGYLVDQLGKFVKEVAITERKLNYEINPAKVDSDELSKNKDNLEAKVTAILSHLLSADALSKMPPGLRLIAKYVADQARRVVPDQVNTLIGSFVFLRYINPAIFSPEAMGLLPTDKVPSPQSRRNLILITKVLQNLANGKTFSNKEAFMTQLNPFVQDNLPRVQSYLEEVAKTNVQEASVHAADEVNELGVNDLHVFHSLVFQHKDKYLPLFGKEEHKNEFLKLLEKIGSYDKKVSFSFLGEVEQKEVKKIMSARNDEASYIGYVTMPNKKGEQEKQILIVGMHRIIWATPKGKVLQDFHQFLLRSVTSLAPNALTLGFKDTEITQSSDEVDIIVDCIRRSVEFCFHGMPQDRKPIIKVQPASRLIETPRIDEPCGGIVATYKSLCDFYDTRPNSQVCWDLDHLYANNRVLDLRKFTSKYIEPLTDKDLLPLFHALAYNHYFVKVVLKHFKFTDKSWAGVVEMMSVNDTIQSLVLQDITFNGSADKCWLALFDAISKNMKTPLLSLSLADSPIEDKAFQPLGEWIRKLNRGIVKLNFNNTCGEKAGKGIGMLSVFESLGNNKTATETFQVLKLSKNKLVGLEPAVARVMSLAPFLNNVELAQSSADMNVIAQLGLANNKQLQKLDISGNKMAKPEQWTALQRYLESPICSLTDLNIASTQVPVPVLKDILTKLGPNSNLTVFAADNNLGKAGAQTLGTIGALMPNIHGLDVADNCFGDEGLVPLFEGFWNNTSLMFLNIARNWSNKPETKKREQLIHHLNQLINNTSCPIETLNAAGGKESRLRETIVPFLGAVGANTRITELDISGHGFGNRGAIALAKALGINHVLTSVNWDDNNTGLLGVGNICDGIQSNHTIKNFPLPWHDITSLYNDSNTDKVALSKFLTRISEKIMGNQLNV